MTKFKVQSGNKLVSYFFADSMPRRGDFLRMRGGKYIVACVTWSVADAGSGSIDDGGPNTFEATVQVEPESST